MSRRGQREGVTSAPIFFVNARLVTGDPKRRAPSELKVVGGRVAGVGGALSAGLPGLGREQVIDCGGRAVVPGFVDAHLHFFALVDECLSVRVGPRAGVRSVTDLAARLRAKAQQSPPGTWIRGKGYDETALLEGHHPNRHDLDVACPRHPVKLTHRSLHAHVLNSLALATVGIDRYTPDPPGGLIDRDLETGDPTGLLYEMGDLLAERVPKLAPEELEQGAARASLELLSAGVTTFQEASTTNGSDRWEQLRRWKRSGVLRQRISVLLGWDGFLELLQRGRDAFPAARGLKLGGLKIVLDRTTGSLHPSPEELVRRVRAAHRLGWPVAIHAVEEETVEAAVSALEALAGERGRRAPRHRIEHCSICPPALISRLAAARVTVVTQPSFLYFSGDRYRKTVPAEVIPDLYPIGSLAAGGVRVAASSDAPVVPARPLVGVTAAVTRQTESGAVLRAEQGVSASLALRMHTRDAAWALGMERSVGSLSVGTWADFVILDRDPMTAPQEELSRIEPAMTVLGGEAAWRKEDECVGFGS